MQRIRTTIEAEPEMIQQLVPAAYERFGDAQAALTSGSPTGSVYLAGDCVERVLKHAALRSEGLPPFAFVRVRSRCARSGAREARGVARPRRS